MMKKTLIIGATGKIGRILVTQHIDAITPAVAMVRNKAQQAFDSSIDIIEADLEHDISYAMDGCCTVIFTAGSGAGTGLDKTLLVDLWGARKAIDVSQNQGIEHFIMVSSRGADDPDNGPLPIKPYLVAKHFADEYLIQSGLCYTILRPGRLTDQAGTGLINTHRPREPKEQVISREDTAAVIAHCIGNQSTYHKIYELYEGRSAIKTIGTSD